MIHDGGPIGGQLIEMVSDQSVPHLGKNDLVGGQIRLTRHARELASETTRHYYTTVPANSKVLKVKMFACPCDGK